MDENKRINLNDKIEVTLTNPQQENYDEISLKELILVLLKGKKLIVGLTLLITALVFVGSVMGPKLLSDSVGEIKTAITYNGGISADINEIRSPAVLKPVIDNLGLDEYDISVDDLRRNIYFEALIPDRIVEKMEQLKDVVDDEFRIQQLDELSYSASEYIVTLNLHKDLGLDAYKGREVLDAIIRSYEGWYYKEYVNRAVLTNVLSDIDMDNYDYPEIIEIFDGQFGTIYSYLNAKIIEDAEFRSSTTGMTFAELKQVVELVDNIELKKADAIIGAYNLTKDKDKLLKLYEYQIANYEMLNKKKTDEMAIVNRMIDSYIKDPSAVIFSSTLNTTNGVSLDNEDQYYNSLIKSYTEASVVAINALNDIELINFKIAKLSDDETESALKLDAVEEVNLLNNRIYYKLNYWIDQINSTLEEYDYNRFYKSTLRQLTPSESYSVIDTNVKLNTAVGMVLGLMISVFMVFFRSYMKNE
jgi:capsular polysaccharide biosynthesis protein